MVCNRQPSARNAHFFTFDKNFEAIIPRKITRTPSARMSMRNWVIISPQESKPKRGIKGIFAMVIGVLKGLFQSGFPYLSQMTERFTVAKMMKVPRFVISATSPMLPIRTTKQGKIITARMAIHGVPLLESFDRL